MKKFGCIKAWRLDLNCCHARRLRRAWLPGYKCRFGFRDLYPNYPVSELKILDRAIYRMI